MASWMGLWWILLVVVFAAGVVILIRAVGRWEPRSQRTDALTILEERYARGEIDRDEFEERRRQMER
jgi:putative membrane protein